MPVSKRISLSPTPDICFAIRALVKFDISKNGLYAEGTKVVAEALKGNQIMTELSISGNRMTYDGSNSGDMSGVIAISNAIPTMRALTSLNLASNLLKAEGAKQVAAALPECK